MKCFIRFAAVLLVTTSLAGGAMAAGKQSDDKTPIGKPVSAWLVGPSQASQFDTAENPGGLGCLMVTEFDNGYIVGVHAREAGIVGMTVDTRKPDLQVGATEQIGLNLGGDSYVLNAVASDASTLSIDLKQAGGGKSVAERLTGLGNFRLLLNQKPVYFATTGFTDGLARLQACMGGTMAVTLPVTGRLPAAKSDVLETMRVTSTGTNTPIAMAMPELIPSGYKFVLEDIDPMTPISWQAGDDWIEVMRMALAPQSLKLSIDGKQIRISKDIGAEDDVVQVAKDGAKKADLEIPEVNAIPPIMDDGEKSKNADKLDTITGVWGGAKGESLASVIEAWGLMAGVKVKVDLMGDLKLPDDVRYEGSFTESVDKLLSQFSGRNRPVGRFDNGASMASALSQPAPVAVLQDAPSKQMAPVLDAEPKSDEPAWKPKSSVELAKLAREAEAKHPTPKQEALVSNADQKKAPVWQALEGTSLRDAVEHWGQSAGAKVVWMTDDEFPLPQTYKKTGSFEQALAGALKLYQDRPLRPQIQLNTDPKTGEKAIIVNTVK